MTFPDLIRSSPLAANMVGDGQQEGKLSGLLPVEPGIDAPMIVAAARENAGYHGNALGIRPILSASM